jgi:7,8-dihydropterin-6-yl-methyl-4-(beta-D-ribofuranosyl)aminobenzene 5'-phosphate synthase
MPERGRVTILVDDQVHDGGLLAEHGLAFWIELRGRRLLFDTGQGMVITHNAARLSIPLHRVDGVALSHGHYDHTGGLGQVMEASPRTEVYAHPAALGRKYAGDGTVREAGMPPAVREKLLEHREALTLVERPLELDGGLFLTGEIPRRTGYETTGGSFFADEDAREEDPLPDDLAVFFESGAGTVVLVGCAHAGVINTLQHIRELTQGRPIHAVVGGMHLAAASQERLDRTIADLRELGVKRIGPCHCTGAAATAELWSAFPDGCFPCGVGTRMEFKLP